LIATGKEEEEEEEEEGRKIENMGKDNDYQHAQ